MSDKSTTPRPWKYNDVSGEVEDANGDVIARVRDDSYKAADRCAEIDRRGNIIVRAVNQYDHVAELVRASIHATDIAEGRLMTIDALHNPSIADNSDVLTELREVNNRLRSALAKMEVQQ